MVRWEALMGMSETLWSAKIISTLCLVLLKQRRNAIWEENRRSESMLDSKPSHAGIIRIGFEGIFSAPRQRGAPLFQQFDWNTSGGVLQ